VCWCLKLSKHAGHDVFYLNANGGWRNTDAMALDARNKGGNLTITPEARVGGLIVYGKGWQGASVGHTGIVTAVTGGVGLQVAKSVIHCSSGNAKTGNAVQETTPEVFFKRKAIYAWPDFLVAA
jgi:hypothetical protein